MIVVMEAAPNLDPEQETVPPVEEKAKSSIPEESSVYSKLALVVKAASFSHRANVFLFSAVPTGAAIA